MAETKVTATEISQLPYFWSASTSASQGVPASSSNAVLANLSITFVAPYTGMAIVRGSYNARPNSAVVTDSSVKFRVNGADITGTGSQVGSYRSITPTDNPMAIFIPFARFPVTAGTSYTVDATATTSSATSMNFQSASSGYTEVTLLPSSNVT